MQYLLMRSLKGQIGKSKKFELWDNVKGKFNKATLQPEKTFSFILHYYKFKYQFNIVVQWFSTF